MAERAPTGLRRLRLGELLATVGALALIVLTFLPWYRGTSGSLTAWDEFGVIDVLIVVAAAAALILMVATITERTPAMPVASAVWTTLFALAATIAIVVGVLDKPDHAVALRPASWLSLIAALTVFAGSWQSMRDERIELYAPAQPEVLTLQVGADAQPAAPDAP